MKKLTFLSILIAILGFTSCQKDELPTRSEKLLAPKVADKTDLGNWD